MKKPDKATEQTEPSRRRFLTGVAAAGGATAAVAASGALAATAGAEPESPVDDGGSAGYRETAHVRAYYDSAKW